MKALSVRQPWANLIAAGAKTIETRRWATNYRGPILIISSKTPAIEPAGKAVAMVELRDCRPMRPSDAAAARCDYAPGLFAWVLGNVERVEPVVVRGHIGLFEVDWDAITAAPDRVERPPEAARRDPWF